MAYSAVGDLLTGNIPTPAQIDPQKFIQDAADEIDGALGHVYITPLVPTSPQDPAVRPSLLILKRISNHIATGRLIMAADAGGQNQALHAYGVSLLNEAHAALKALALSSDTLPGMPTVPDQAAEDTQSGPRIYNEDQHSNVAAFYEYVHPDRVMRRLTW